LKFNFVANFTCGKNIFRLRSNEDNSSEEGFVKQKTLQSIQARTSALNEIKKTIQEGHIDFTTLKEYMFFLEESYLQAWPTDCLHCPKEYEKDPDNVAGYHQTHINKCI